MRESKGFEYQNRTINGRTVTVWLTDFYWYKKMRKLLTAFSLSRLPVQISNYFIQDLERLADLVI